MSIFPTARRQFKRTKTSLHSYDEASLGAIPKLYLLIFWLAMLYIGAYTAWVIDRTLALVF